MTTIVHVIDDDPAIRDSIAVLLATEGFGVRAHDCAVSFLAVAEDAPGCVVTDVRMPGVSGIELMGLMAERGLDHPVVVITGHADVPLAVTAMKHGAVDLLEKPFDPDELVAAVRGALQRRGRQEARDPTPREAARRLSSLSAREQEVLNGLLSGQPNKIIAFEIGISPRTVEVHRANLMRKAGARNLSDLVRLTMIAAKGSSEA